MASEIGKAAVIDIGPVHVRGALRARYARVVWADGILYIVSRRQGRIERQVVKASEPVKPSSPRGYWRAESDAGLVSFTSKGCGG